MNNRKCTTIGKVFTIAAALTPPARACCEPLSVAIRDCVARRRRVSAQERWARHWEGKLSHAAERLGSHAHGPPRRDVARPKSNHHKQERHGHKGGWIGRADECHEASHHPR